jgi:hypothetical protein
VQRPKVLVVGDCRPWGEQLGWLGRSRTGDRLGYRFPDADSTKKTNSGAIGLRRTPKPGLFKNESTVDSCSNLK